MTLVSQLPPGCEVLEAKWLYGEAGESCDYFRVVAVTR